MTTTLIIWSALLLIATAAVIFYAERVRRDNNHDKALLEAKDNLIKTLHRESAFSKDDIVWCRAAITVDGVAGEKSARKRLASKLGYFILRKYPDAIRKETAGDANLLTAQFHVKPANKSI